MRGVASAAKYDDSDGALYRQVTVAEVDALLEAGMRQFLRDGSKLVHLLTRVRSTLVQAHESVRGLQQRVADQSAHLARVGTPTTLNPMDALRYLDDVQKEAVFDRISRERLATLRTLVARAQADADSVAAELALVRSVGRDLSAQAELPPHVRAQVARKLAALPTSARVVHRPAMLDYPGMGGTDPFEAMSTPAPATERPTDPPPAVRPPTPVVAIEPAVPAAPATGPAVFVDPYAATPMSPEPVYRDPYAPTDRSSS